MRALVPVALLAVASASAQDVQQTPENAQRFLRLVAEQSEIKAYPPGDRDSVAYIVRFRSDETCVTQVDGLPYGYYKEGNWTDLRLRSPRPDEVEGALLLHRVTGPPWTINWGLSYSVNIESTEVWPMRIVRISDASGSRNFFMPDEATAQRVRRAMQFLKEHCDQTAETGF